MTQRAGMREPGRVVDSLFDALARHMHCLVARTRGLLSGQIVDMLFGNEARQIRKFAVEAGDRSRLLRMLDIESEDRMNPSKGVRAARLPGVCFCRIQEHRLKAADGYDRENVRYNPLWDLGGCSRTWIR